MEFDSGFYRGKRVLITGHTGFKGAWLSRVLLRFGAEVTGYSLEPPTEPNLFAILDLEKQMRSVTGDVRDLESLKRAFDGARPEIVLHLAAQPLVREGYRNPAATYATNVMGTVNVLECIRTGSSVRSFLNVTTDKVYRNREWEWGYREDEELNGRDPYSNSKSCSELVTDGYRRSFFGDRRTAISTARAGNVIGGGDFAEDRILPDCVRAALEKRPVVIRNPFSVRPYQHVLEPVFAYLMIAAGQYEDGGYADCYNVGPEAADCRRTGDLADLFAGEWGEGFAWVSQSGSGPHEANFLKLDASKLKARFGWRPRWGLDTAVAKTVEWTKCWRDGRNAGECVDRQIEEFILAGEREGGPGEWSHWKEANERPPWPRITGGGGR